MVKVHSAEEILHELQWRAHEDMMHGTTMKHLELLHQASSRRRQYKKHLEQVICWRSQNASPVEGDPLAAQCGVALAIAENFLRKACTLMGKNTPDLCIATAVAALDEKGTSEQQVNRIRRQCCRIYDLIVYPSQLAEAKVMAQAMLIQKSKEGYHGGTKSLLSA